MKKVLLIAAFLTFGSLPFFAQAPSNPWFWDLNAGYNNSNKWMDGGWNYSTRLGYAFTDNFKLNFDMGYLEGKVKDSSVKDHIWTFMLAPEYATSLTDSDQVYGFIGAGFARRDSFSYTLNAFPSPGRFAFGSETKWAAEAGVGYRHFFTKNVGINLQATYTHMGFNDVEKINTVDGRIGLAVRF